MLYKKGLAYQAEALVNYDPVDKTVLANEQVDSNGRSWRSGAVVEQRMLRQWFFQITAFQEALLNDLDSLAANSRWPDRVIQQQKNWIGRSSGATIQFEIMLGDGSQVPVRVFTTRPDTLFGVTYLALSFSHPIVQDLAKSNSGLASFLSKRGSFDHDSKEGFELPVRAIHPASILSSEISKTIPVFVAPYVLDGYGEGAVMGVPAHDTRDFSFWRLQKPHDSMPVVIRPQTKSASDTNSELQEAYIDHGILTTMSGPYAEMDSRDAASKIVEDLNKHGRAQKKETWRLRDWLISRQRYWGTPIPIIHCQSCGAVPVPDDQLPVELPALGEHIRGQKGNPLDNIEAFINVDCPSCGNPARRETDTMDTFVDSSWYYARFPDSQNDAELFSKDSASRMLPVDMYIGGVEHAILHLLYARFVFKFFCEEGLIPSSEDQLSKEPFSRLIAQGMVHGKTFSDPMTGRFLKPEELVFQDDSEPPLIKATGQKAAVTWEKMSKSKHNGVDPITCFQKYGADVTRAHMLFAAPLSEVLQWDEEKIVGVQRWLYRLSRLVDDFLALPSKASSESEHSPTQTQTRQLSTLSDADAAILLLTTSTLRSVTNTLDSNIYNVNTVISDLIKLTNALDDTKLTALNPAIATDVLHTIVKMLAPVAPAFAEQCWEDLHLHVNPVSANEEPATTRSIFNEPWPSALLTPTEETQLQSRRTTITCAVQINGKLKFTTSVPAPPAQALDNASDSRDKKQDHENAVIEAILATEQGQLWLRERNEWEKRKRVIVVGGGKVVNIVF